MGQVFLIEKISIQPPSYGADEYITSYSVFYSNDDALYTEDSNGGMVSISFKDIENSSLVHHLNNLCSVLKSSANNTLNKLKKNHQHM